MKRALLMVAVLSLSLWGREGYAEPFGPSLPPDRAEGILLSAGYFRGSTEWKSETSTFPKLVVRQNQAYVELADPSWSITEDGGGFLRIGAADFDDGQGYKAGYKLFGSAGIRDTWYGERRSRFSVGTVLQGSYYMGSESESTFPSGIVSKAKVTRVWEGSLGVSAQWRIGDRVLVYGGPSATYGMLRWQRSVTNGTLEKAEYTNKDILGVFGGARLSLSRRWTLGAEAQGQGGFSGGVSVAYAYGF